MSFTLFSKVSMIAMAAAAVCLLAPAAPVQAQSENSTQACSNGTLSGDYGFTIEGTILAANAPVRGIALQHYDGRGHITQVDHLVFNGDPTTAHWAPGTGSYSVNPDCTGFGVINTPSNPTPVNIHFVIVDHGRQIKQVVDANAVVANGIKVN